jgi:hypothetical protein
VSALLVVAATSLVRTGPAHAQASAPNSDLTSYVLFGFEDLAFKGGQGNHGPSIIDGGNIGANGMDLDHAAVNVCANAQMIMSDDTMVVGDSMRMGDAGTPTQECDVFQAFYNTPIGNPETPRSGPAQPFQAPVIKASPPIPDFACDPANDVTIPANSPPTTLPPGTYGDVNFQNGTTVTLESGEYTMCRFTSGQHVTVITEPNVVIGSQQDFLMRDDMHFDGSDCATIPIVYVRGQGLSENDNAVTMGQDSEVWGHFYAPTGTLNLGNQTDLHGTFWARNIRSDFNVNVQYCPPPIPNPPTGNIEVSKTVSGAVDGAPPNATYTIHYRCTIPGPGVRNAINGSFPLRAGETVSFTDVQVGTTCRAAEVDRPDPLPGFVFDPPTITPEEITVEEEGQTVDVVVDNPLREVFGTIKVTKKVTGDTAGQVPGSTFGFKLDCDDNAFDTTFELADGETFTSDPIHTGVTCTINETDRPAAADGFAYERPTFDPDQTVTIARENQTVTVEVDNPIGKQPHEPAGTSTQGNSPAQHHAAVASGAIPFTGTANLYLFALAGLVLVSAGTLLLLLLHRSSSG